MRFKSPLGIQLCLLPLLLFTVVACKDKVEPQLTENAPCSGVSFKIRDSAFNMVYPDYEPARVAKAKQLLSDRIEADSNCQELVTSLALLQARDKEYEALRKTYRHLLRLEPRNPGHMSMMGLVQEALGNEEVAFRKYRMAADVYYAILDSMDEETSINQEAYLKFNRGLCKLLAGQEAEAHELIREVHAAVQDSVMQDAIDPFLTISRSEYIDLIWSGEVEARP